MSFLFAPRLLKALLRLLLSALPLLLILNEAASIPFHGDIEYLKESSLVFFFFRLTPFSFNNFRAFSEDMVLRGYVIPAQVSKTLRTNSVWT